MKNASNTKLGSVGNGLYVQTSDRKQLSRSIFLTPAKIDRTEYCEECRCYHDRPTWPIEHTYQRRTS